MAFCDPLNNNGGGNYFGNCLADCLTDLRLSELLLLKKSMEKITMKHESNDGFDSKSVVQTDGALIERTDCVDQHCAQPQRMALMASTSLISDRGVDHHHQQHHHNGQQTAPWHSWPSSAIEEKPSKLQTLFQISITALSFLSFGGYLLCLIVQAIKSKGTTYFHPVATATTATANGGGVRRIKIYRRGRRSVTHKKVRQRQQHNNNKSIEHYKQY